MWEGGPREVREVKVSSEDQRSRYSLGRKSRRLEVCVCGGEGGGAPMKVEKVKVNTEDREACTLGKEEIKEAARTGMCIWEGSLQESLSKSQH